MGLMAAADPYFAERLLQALRRLPTERANAPAAECEGATGLREEVYA
jgi:hypothetical protein